MSGRARGPSSTSTPPAWPVSGARAIAAAAGWRSATPTSGRADLYLHVAVDDNSRYAYVEQHPDERAPTCAAFLERALAHFGELGMGPVEAVMTDGARNYRTAAVFQEALARAGARHILTPPYTPRWNGKAERFIQTLKAEWAYAHEWPSSLARARALILASHLQSAQAPQLAGGPAADQPRHNVRG